MTGDGLGERRRRIRFRAWRRGLRELDLLLGPFADAALDGLGEAELTGFEALLDLPDQSLVRWITGEEAVPAEHRTDLLLRVIAFHHHRVATGAPLGPAS